MLQVLRLENNRLEFLPDNFGELHSLIKLDVSTNCLRQLPASMGRLKRIQRIDAANNLLTRVPPAMGHLKSLKEFNLKYNSLDDRYKAKAEAGLARWATTRRAGGVVRVVGEMRLPQQFKWNEAYGQQHQRVSAAYC